MPGFESFMLGNAGGGGWEFAGRNEATSGGHLGQQNPFHGGGVHFGSQSNALLLAGLAVLIVLAVKK